MDGKELWRNWEPRAHAARRARPGEDAPPPELHPRGISEQPVAFVGHAPGVFHRREKVPNLRRLRELPHHICNFSGRAAKVDPVSRALINRPPTPWGSRTEADRTAQLMYEQSLCNLEAMEATFLAHLGFEIAQDMLLGRQLFPYSEPIRQFHKFFAGNVAALEQRGASKLTWQTALNAAGNAQALLVQAAEEWAGRCVEERIHDGRPDVWCVQTNTGEVMNPLAVSFVGHFRSVFGCDVTAQDELLVTCGTDATLRIWDALVGQQMLQIDAHTAPIRRCVFSADNKWILTACADGTAGLFTLKDCEEVLRLSGHDGEVLDAIFLQPKVAMTCSEDTTLMTWDLETGEEKLVFRGHTSLVTTVKRLLEGRQAASCSYDKTIRIWDTATAECVLTLTGHAHIIYGMPPPLVLSGHAASLTPY